MRDGWLSGLKRRVANPLGALRGAPMVRIHHRPWGAAKFYEAYCERSGIAPAELAAYGKRAYRCSCGEEGCEGWAMLSRESVEFDREHGCPTRGIDRNDGGYAPEAQS